MSRLSAEKVQSILKQKAVFKAEIIHVVLEKHKAFSHSSRLARYIVSLTNGQTKYIRANVWPVSAFRIAETLSAQKVLKAPQPIYYDKSSHTILYEELNGDTLRSVPLTVKAWKPIIPKVAQILAAFHQTPLPKGLEPETQSAAKRRRKNLVQGIQKADKGYGALAKVACSQLESQIARQAGKVKALTHGDFQASNILIAKKNLLLIDFTLSRPNHPASDLGLWLVHWQAMTRGHLSHTQREELGYLFLQHYFSAVPKAWHAPIQTMLPAYVSEATLEVAATTLLMYGAHDTNVRALLDELFSSLNYV